MQTSSGQRLSGFQFSGTTAGVAQPSARTTSGQRSLGVRLRIRSKASADSSFVTPKRPIPSVQPLVSKTQKGWRQLPASSSQVPINVMQPSAMGEFISKRRANMSTFFVRFAHFSGIDITFYYILRHLKRML